MPISALQISHAAAKRSHYTIIGMGAEIVLTASGFDDLALTVATLSISRGDSNYTVITVPIGTDAIDDILAIVGAEATITLKLLMHTLEGLTFVSNTVPLSIADFRVDIGIRSSTIALVSRSALNIPASQQSEVLHYSSKKLSGSALSNNYIYVVNPFDYSRYSKGTTIVDGGMTGKIVSSRLSLTPNRIPSLTIEVQPNAI